MAAVDWALRRSYCKGRFFLFGCSSFPSPFFTFAYSSSSFAWIIQRFLHLRSIVNNKLLVFAQPIDKAAIMLAKFISCTYRETTLFSLYRTDYKFVNLLMLSEETVCFAFTIKLVLFVRATTKRAYLLAGGAICLPCSQLK
jgi:hypothetical protein